MNRFSESIHMKYQGFHLSAEQDVLMRLKLSDIARMANVSRTTASYVLNGKAESRGISPATTERVIQVAKTHGFVLDKGAGSLRRGTNHLIGFVAPFWSSFYEQLNQALEEEFEQHGYQMLFGTSFTNIDRERKYIENLVARRVDGVILIPVDLRAPHLQYLTRNKMPAVYLRHRSEPSSDKQFISFDDVQAGYIAAKCLIQRGCTRLALCSGSFAASTEFIQPIHGTRLQGVRQAMEEAGLAFQPETNVLWLEWSDESSLYTLIEQIRERKIDGIVGLSDLVCLRLMRPLHEMGIHIPDDIRIVGFDDTDYAQFNYPGLTSVRFPKEEMGRLMATTLLQMIQADKIPGDEILLPGVLIPRESTGDNGSRSHYHRQREPVMGHTTSQE